MALGELDALVVTTSWADHLQPAIDAMKAGKRVAMEVGGAYSLDQLWQLVHTSEETGIPCMMLENCCYGRDELMVRNMVEQGVFGEIVHCQGGYHHDLRHEISFGRENRHYRLDNYKNPIVRLSHA
ncbi:MAG: Gfo/Idh/MocA family protein [Bianqueaceae bacterium]